MLIPHAQPWVTPAPRVLPRLVDAAALARGLEAGLLAFMIGTRAAYFLFMWLVTAYEAAMMAGLPILHPAIEAGLVSPDARLVLYQTANNGHFCLLPAVCWFLLYQGLPALARR